MLEFIRGHKRLTQLLLLLFIIPSFAFVGLEGYNRFGADANVVAKVAGYSITTQELEAAQREQMDRFRQMLGTQFDQKLLDTPEMRQSVLDKLIAQRALLAELSRKNLSVSDQALQQAILSMPGLTSQDGKFDGERYASLLAAQGLTPSSYEASLRQDLALQQLNSAIQSSAFAPKTMVARLSGIAAQEREIQQLNFNATDFNAQAKVTDDMLQSYYKNNSTQYAIPEQLKIEYVILNSSVVESQLSITDADIQSYYEQNAKRYTLDEQRRASHILIAVKKDASSAEVSVAKAKAENLLTQLRKNPAEFAKLAKENSQDPGSAERGGDLDFFSHGMMVKPFEEAAYKLKQGEISDIIRSDFGFHIIQVSAIKPASVKPLDDARAEIAAEIKKQMTAKKYAEMAEIFSNTIYEQSDSLKPVADKLKLTIETAFKVTRQIDNTAGNNIPFNNPKFLQALFSDDVIKNKHNTEAVEIAPNILISGRVVEYKPTSMRPFEEVKASVRERVTQIEARNLAKKAGESKLASLQKIPSSTGFSATKTVSRVQKSDLSSGALAATMKADISKLPAFFGVDVPAQGYAIYRINKVTEPTIKDQERLIAERQQISNALAQQEMLTYINYLKQKAIVKILQPISSKNSNS
ncbi:MAG: peptidylprolyl isomerase [Glaciimonas sp.]|nr:peptidylprolyl isomerase [Glaciimonas sp.]